MARLEGERLGAEQHPLDAAEPGLVAGERRIARRRRRRRPRPPAGSASRSGRASARGRCRGRPSSTGRARSGRAPCAPARPSGRVAASSRASAARRASARSATPAGRRTTAASCADQRQVVLRPERMGDDDLRRRLAPGADRLDRLPPVLVDVDEHVRRRQPAQLGQVHGLGAADLRHPAPAPRPGGCTSRCARPAGRPGRGRRRARSGSAPGWRSAPRTGCLAAHAGGQSKNNSLGGEPPAIFPAVHLYSPVCVWKQRLLEIVHDG